MTCALRRRPAGERATGESGAFEFGRGERRKGGRQG